MTRLLQNSVLFLALSLVLVQCRKKEWDAYYGRPDWLEAPIYQQLEARGNFKELLTCIDKANYKDILGKAGYWTFFAPHDSAFQVFLKERNLTSAAQLDSGTCSQIVTYCLVYNGFKKERLDDFQSNAGWVENTAFKRRTANYTWVYQDKDTLNRPVTAVSANRNGSYVANDNNNKYLPYFVDNYMNAKRLTAYDYNYFFPNSTYTGFNVLDAKVTEADIPAENGVIHVIDKVLMALPNIDQYLASKPEYSEFKKLFDRYMVQYVLNQDVSKKYQTRTGNAVEVFTRMYDAQLAFSLNNENYMKLQDNDGQSDGYSIFVPRNEELIAYINDVLLEHYTDLNTIPLNIIYDFLNAHLWQSTVWPSKFATTSNFLGEEARFNPNTDILEKKILSNGIFYGAKKVQEANVFSSVYGKAYLNPEYSLMVRALDNDLKPVVSNPNLKFTLFMMPNTILRAWGFNFNIVYNYWEYQPVGGVLVSGNAARDRLLRILYTHVLLTPNDELQNLSGTKYVKTWNEEYIKVQDGKIISTGNQDSSVVTTVVDMETARNGRVYYVDRLLTYSELNIGKHIEQLGTDPSSPYHSFWMYLQSSANYNAGIGAIPNVTLGTPYTVFIPNNQAILAAVNAGLLPGTGTAPNKVPNFNPAAQADKDLVSRFIAYHILNRKTVATDGLESGSFETMMKDFAGDPTTVFVNNTPGNIQLTDSKGRNASVVPSGANNLSNRAMIHLINNYLEYVY